MYEISLVPDIKAELLKQQKLRNLIILICIVVAIACGAVLLILGGIVGTQAITIETQKAEIKCRSIGEGNCRNTGTAVSNFHNLNELLTMQSQMKDLSVLNANKIKLSRLFPIFDAILPDDPVEGTVSVTEASMDFSTMSFYMEAVSYNSIAFTAQEAFRKNLPEVYYDYGDYMRKDKETDEYVTIPSFCITEATEDGIVYGYYYKGKPGCEAPMVEETKKEDESKEKDENDTTAEEAEKEEENAEVDDNLNTDYEIIKIRRTYTDEEDKTTYINGNDKLRKDGEPKVKDYYFESQCIKYDSDGKFDEDSTLEACPLVNEEPDVFDGSYGKNDEGQKILTFSASFVLNRGPFVSANKHMMIVGPSRRNVTDSYQQVRPIFSEKDEVVEETK